MGTRIKEIYKDIFCIKLPLPGDDPGPLNAYIFKGKNITLLDTGTRRNIVHLQKALQQLHLEIKDIDQIVITHGHPDHYGAAQQIRLRSGARVIAPAGDRKIIENGREWSLRDYIRLLNCLGVNCSFKICAMIINYLFARLVEKCPVDVEINEGDLIQLGDYTGRVIQTPGHSVGSVCIYLENEDILFSGDHIIKHIVPNPFISAEGEKNEYSLPSRRTHAQFFASLEKIKALNPSIIHSGHGEPVTDLNEVVKLYREQYEKRQARLLEVMRNGPFTVYEATRFFYSNLKGLPLIFNFILCLSMIYTHLQALEDQNLITSYMRDNLLYYRIVH